MRVLTAPHDPLHGVDGGDGNVTRRGRVSNLCCKASSPSSSLFFVVHELRIVLDFKRDVKITHKILQQRLNI